MSRRFDNFAARLAGEPVPTVPEVEPETQPPILPGDAEPELPPQKEPEEESHMSDQSAVEQTAKVEAAFAAGLKAANDRMAAVFASEHFPGREAAAAKYLQMDMSAEQIAAVLGDIPVRQAVSQEQANAAAEEAARQAMQAHLNSSPNAELGADNGSNPGAKANPLSAWDYADAYIKGVK